MQFIQLVAKALLLLVLGILPAHAIEFEEGEYGQEYIDLIPKAPLGATPWKTLFSISEKEEVDQGLTIFRPVFPPVVEKLGGTTLRVKGFLFPLDMAEKQKRFLLSAFPPSCPFHAPGGPRHIIEVESPEGVDFTYDPILMEGEFELLDGEEGLYYKMNGAKLIEE